MSRRLERLSVLLTLVVSLDFGSPFVGGAFRFEADESLEGLTSAARSARPSRLALPAPVSPAQNLSQPRPASPMPGPKGKAHEKWVADLRKAHAPGSHPPPSTEEH